MVIKMQNICEQKGHVYNVSCSHFNRRIIKITFFVSGPFGATIQVIRPGKGAVIATRKLDWIPQGTTHVSVKPLIWCW